MLEADRFLGRDDPETAAHVKRQLHEDGVVLKEGVRIASVAAGGKVPERRLPFHCKMATR